MLAKPSDGPWRVEPISIPFHEGILHSFAIVPPCNEVIGFAVPCNRSTGAEFPAEANARLMTAAPDLLEACRVALVALREVDSFDDELIPTLQAAIAKTTGQEATHDKTD